MAQLPIGYEDRLRRVLHELVHLQVFVVDPYDLACSKLLRGNAHDRDHLIALHAIEPFEQHRLVATYREFLNTFVGDPTEPQWSLVHLVDEIWGELDAVALRRELFTR